MVVVGGVFVSREGGKRVGKGLRERYKGEGVLRGMLAEVERGRPLKQAKLAGKGSRRVRIIAAVPQQALNWANFTSVPNVILTRHISVPTSTLD